MVHRSVSGAPNEQAEGAGALRVENRSLTRVVAVFAGRYASETGIESVEAMARKFPNWKFLVLQEFPPRNRRRLLVNRLKRLTSDPIAYPLRILRARSRARSAAKARNGVHLPARLDQIEAGNVEYVRVARLHDESTLARLRAERPWLGVAIQSPILKPGLFTMPEKGTINLHKSLLPEYRGMPPGFWELHDGAERTGATVHWIDEGLDTGRIIAQEELPIPEFTTPRGLQVLLDVVGLQVLLEALARIDSGETEGAPQGTAQTPTRSRPSRGVEQAVERRCLEGRRRKEEGSLQALRLVKAPVLAAYLYGWCPIRNFVRSLFGRSRTAVLLYHRVSDDQLDNLTVGVEQFMEQLRCLRRHYEVVDPAAFLEGRGQRQRKARVVITFDDGYKDNFVAAMLLRRAGVPAAFFVSTRIVGTDRAFPHDLKRHGHGFPVLSWEEIGEMAAAGFAIGNHTADHEDLGAVSTDCAIDQVRMAREDLETRLPGTPGARWLAYPYGRPKNITEDVRALLPSVGMEYCFSAYGGTNPSAFDRWNVRRQGVDHSMSLLRLRAAIEGWSVRS